MPPQQPPHQPLTSVEPDADHSALWKVLALLIGILLVIGAVFSYIGFSGPASSSTDQVPPPPPPPLPTAN